MDTATTELLHASMPLCATLEMRTLLAAPNEVVLAMDHAPERCTAAGLTHGGALMALADSAGALCAFLNLPEGATSTATTESATRFLGAHTEGQVRAVSRPLQLGRTLIVIETELRDDEDRLIAKTTQTQIVRSPDLA